MNGNATCAAVNGKQASNDLLASVEATVRQALASNGGGAVASATDDAARQVTALQAQVSHLQEENDTLRGTNAKLVKENKQMRQQNSAAGAAPATPTTTRATTPTKATHHHNSSTTGRLQVDETATAYPLSLDVPGGVQLDDLNIFVRALALQKSKARRTHLTWPRTSFVPVTLRRHCKPAVDSK